MNQFKLKLILLLAFAQPLSAIAQKALRSPLADAIDYHNPVLKNERARILKSYSNSLSTLHANRFISVTTGDSVSFISKTNKEAEINLSQGASGNPLGAPLIDALGTVIAKRFKEELTLAFLESFREKLKSEPYLAELFPNTTNILLNGDPFNHKVWLTSFRGALDEDLKVLPDNLPALLKELSKNLNEKQKTILTSLLDIYSPALAFTQNPQKSYISIVQLMDLIKKVDFDNENLAASLKFSALLIKELGNADKNDWASSGTLSNLSNPEITKTFIGFTIEKYSTQLEKVKITSIEPNLYLLFHNLNFNKADEYIVFLNSIRTNISSISESLKALLIRQKSAALTYSDYLPIVDQNLAALSTLMNDNIASAINGNYKPSDKLATAIENTQLSVKYISTTYANLSAKEYSKVLVTTLDFITEFVDQDSLNNRTELKEFIKYTNLATSLAGATTSEEMVAAIEGAALPSQSYRLKRNSYFSVSLNSYAGVFAAKEFLLSTDAKNDTSNVIGFTAPIGIGLNWGLVGKKTSKYANYNVRTGKDKDGNKAKAKYFVGHSISVFASVIDVGAITTFRLTDDQTPVTGIQWQNIFAPGAYVVWGIGNTPMALMIGGQYGPELRTVTAEDDVATPTITSSAWRFGVSLTVDIPLIHFSAKTEKFKDKTKSKVKSKAKGG